MIWSETPPTESGWYWVRDPGSESRMWPAERRVTGVWSRVARDFHVDDEAAAELVEFGPPIPSPEQCAEIAKGESCPTSDPK